MHEILSPLNLKYCIEILVLPNTVQNIDIALFG